MTKINHGFWFIQAAINSPDIFHGVGRACKIIKMINNNQ
jgi:hypothetical protein